MNYILGSGIIGLTARHILGADWQVVPFYKSRFFSSNPPLDDNFLCRHERLDYIIDKLLPSKLVNSIFYKRSWSLNGILSTNGDSIVINDWLDKVYGNDVPGQSLPYYLQKDIFQIYNNVRISEIYKALLDLYLPMLKQNSTAGMPTSIKDGYIYFGEERKPYDNIISTIPADVLYGLTGRNSLLKTKDLHYLHLYTEELDFEGANQIMVADRNIEFFKVSNIAPSRYLFYFLNDILHPGIYMQNFLKKFEIIDGTMVKQALTLGNTIDIGILKKENIHPIGSYAVWDPCLDVASCFLRLLNTLDTGFKK